MAPFLIGLNKKIQENQNVLQRSLARLAVDNSLAIGQWYRKKKSKEIPTNPNEYYLDVRLPPFVYSGDYTVYDPLQDPDIVTHFRAMFSAFHDALHEKIHTTNNYPIEQTALEELLPDLIAQVNNNFRGEQLKVLNLGEALIIREVGMRNLNTQYHSGEHPWKLIIDDYKQRKKYTFRAILNSINIPEYNGGNNRNRKRASNTIETNEFGQPGQNDQPNSPKKAKEEEE